MAERESIAVRVKVHEVTKLISLSYPSTIGHTRASRAFIGFSRDTNVQESLMSLKDNCGADLITVGDFICGIQIPEC